MRSRSLRPWRLTGAVLLGAALVACPAGSPPVITPNEQGWWRDDVLYEIFVRSFADSNGDGKGDLPGLIARLDYLNDGNPETTTDLGVDGLWLMPVFVSPSYHGYDVTDYRDVDPDYGTLADMDALIAAAHQRGIKVILDMVMNHTSSQHPWFKSANALKSSPYRDYYVIRSPKPSGTWARPWDGGNVWYQVSDGSWYYAIYGAGLPDLNWKNPKVEQEFLDIMRFWLDRGVDGFRFDAVRYLVESDDGKLADQPKTHEIIQRLRYELHQDYPQALLLAEAWASNSIIAPYYGDANEFQLAFAFEIADGIRNSINAGTRAALNQANYSSSAAFPDRGFEAPFLTNHDQARTMRQLTGTQTTPAWDEARLAAALLMGHPGTPFLYYGEEIGMAGGASARDEDKRTPMRWTADAPFFGFTTFSSTWYGALATEPEGVDVATQQADPSSLWSLYRELIALRKGDAALRSATASRPAITGGGDGVFALLREGAGGEKTLLVVNFAATASGAFTVAAGGAPTVLKAEGLPGPPAVQDGALAFGELGPRAFAFVRLE